MMMQSRTAHQQMMHISAMMSLMLCPSTITRASVFSAGWGAFDGTVEDAGRGAGWGAFEGADDATEEGTVEEAGGSTDEEAGSVAVA